MVEIKKANLTLDLNGHTITGSGSFTNNPLFRVESGSFTVNDSSTDGNGKITSSAPLGNIQFGASDATLNIQGGTIENTYANGYGISIHEGNLSISGGTIVNSNSGYAVFTHTNTNNITISGGTISGYYGISTSNDTFIISGGSISGSDTAISTNSNSASVSISGGTISGGKYAVNNKGTVDISGGTIEGQTSSGIQNVSVASAVNISDGTIRGAIGINNARGSVTVSGGSVSGNTYAIYNQTSTSNASLTGGTYNGQLATKSTSTENIGYTIEGTNSPTFTSNTLLSADSTLLKYAVGTGKDSFIGAQGWNATTTDNQYFYLSTTDDINGTKEFTLDNLITASNVNIDSDNKVVGVPTSDIVSGETVTVNDDSGYKLATVKYNNDKSAATVASFADSTSINSAVLGNTVATVTGVENSYTLYIGGSDTLKAITGGDKDDTLVAGNSGATLNGGEGSDSLKGGNGSDLFIYTAGVDSINNFGNGDIIALNGFAPTDATFTSDANNVSLTFDNNYKLVFEAVNNELPISLRSGKNIYTYTKDYYALNGKSVTLPASFNKTTFAAGDFDTVDASAVSLGADSFISISGNANNNLLIGSRTGGSLNGGAGNDLLDVYDRNSDSKFTFEYTAGKDSVNGFDEDNDQLAIDDANNISATKASSGKLVLNFNDKNNVLTLKGDNDIEKVSLNGGGFLTKDGVVSGTRFALFGNAKGRIDLTDTPYKGTDINVVNATAAKKQSVTLTGGSVGGAFTFAENKKKDLFEYGGENVTISGYEAGKDRINLGNASIKSFELAGTNNSDVVLTLDNGKAMSIAGAAGHEVLIHDANSRSNSYAKTVFYANGVLHNKEKRPTIATVSAGASGYQADNSIKKIFVTGGVSGIGVYAGNNKTTLDASEAGGVSLYGGAKNDKLIGSTAKADTFIYSAGKDVIEGYSSGESISLSDTNLKVEDAKITLSKSSLKLKFSTKNTLTLKDSDLSTIKVDGTNYTFAKNAYSEDGGANVSLTSQFSGTYKIDAEDAGKITAVDGSAVKKNLTFKGTTAAETFTGGQKKTTFKGGGGNDTFIGNDTGKDIFFYAKGDEGNVTIQNFGTNDKLKIASGTLSDISTVSGGIQFTMKKSKNDTTKAGTFKVEASNPNEVLIKANNTYYWFADSTTTGKTDGVSVGDLITADTKITKAQANTTGYAIIDLGYSTNLAKSNVAVKAGDFTFRQGKITKNT